MVTDAQRPYAVLTTPEAQRHMDRLHEKTPHAALELIHGALAADPHRIGKPLVGELEGLWSARRADYRVIYEIDDDTHTITVHRIQHRRDVYRSR